PAALFGAVADCCPSIAMPRFFFFYCSVDPRDLHSFPTRRSSDLHQQTQNQRYGSSHIDATAKDISNVVTDAASGVVDIFHGIDKAVADTWNNFWKDGNADGIGSTLSRKYPSGLTPSQLYVFMRPNLGGFFMVRSYYPSECHADYFDFERIESLKPAIEACGISTLSQSPRL